MTIPGYGPGIVQDVGGSVNGTHIDIWFPSHKEAVTWGTRKIKVNVVRVSVEPRLAQGGVPVEGNAKDCKAM